MDITSAKEFMLEKYWIGPDLSVLDHLAVGGLLPGSLLLEQRQGVGRDDPLGREVVHLKQSIKSVLHKNYLFRWNFKIIFFFFS